MKVEYRHPTEANAEEIARVANLSNREIKHHTETTADDIVTRIFKDKDFDPAGYLLGFVNGQAVALISTWISKASIDAGNNYAHANVSVVPEWRNRSIEEHAMDFLSGYLRSKGIVYLRFWAPRESSWKIEIAAKTGMKDIRHAFMMKCVGKNCPDNPEIQKNYELQCTMLTKASEADMKEIMDVLNDSFSESWGFVAQELDDFTKDRDEERRTGKTITRMTYAKVGDSMVGACFGSIRNDYNQQYNAKAGWAHALGVLKAHRRSGLGRALLADSMAWLREMGMDTLYLGVDAENDGALNLYRSLGYVVEEETIVYELKL